MTFLSTHGNLSLPPQVAPQSLPPPNPPPHFGFSLFKWTEAAGWHRVLLSHLRTPGRMSRRVAGEASRRQMRLLPGRSESAWGLRLAPPWSPERAADGSQACSALSAMCSGDQARLCCRCRRPVTWPVPKHTSLSGPASPLLPFCSPRSLLLLLCSPISSSILPPLIYPCPSLLYAPSFFLSPSGSFPFP